MNHEVFSFECKECGATHEGVQDLYFAAPYYYFELDDDERLEAELTEDTCVIRNESFFVRGVLEIPIQGHDNVFGYGVWVSLSKVSFDRYIELFSCADEILDGPFFGWLSNAIVEYPDTLGMKCDVKLLPYPSRPEIKLHRCEHPLAIDQEKGMPESKLREILTGSMHPE